MARICSSKCIYYPEKPTSIRKEYVDENGLKHREAILLCDYDDHRITKFCKCENYLERNSKFE